MDLSVVTVGINLNKWNKVFAGLGRLTRDIAAVVVSSENGGRHGIILFLSKVHAGINFLVFLPLLEQRIN